jgi:hypothetical protein
VCRVVIDHAENNGLLIEVLFHALIPYIDPMFPKLLHVLHQ